MLGAFSSLAAGNAESANADALRQQARSASNQALRDEEAQRREARQVLGEQAAAMAQAGGGYGGTNEKLLTQSATLAELDALNIRYGGFMRRSGLLAEAVGAKASSGGFNLQAGGQLLQGLLAGGK